MKPADIGCDSAAGMKGGPSEAKAPRTSDAIGLGRPLTGAAWYEPDRRELVCADQPSDGSASRARARRGRVVESAIAAAGVTGGGARPHPRRDAVVPAHPRPLYAASRLSAPKREHPGPEATARNVGSGERGIPVSLPEVVTGAMKPTAAETEKGMSRSHRAATPPVRAIGTALNTMAAYRAEPRAPSSRMKFSAKQAGTRTIRRRRAAVRFSNCPPQRAS